ETSAANRPRSGTVVMLRARATATVPLGTGTSSIADGTLAIGAVRAARGLTADSAYANPLSTPRLQTAPDPITIVVPSRTSSVYFKGAHYIHGISQLHRQRHHRSRRTRARSQAPGHVYRRRRLSRSSSPRLGSARQRRRRGHEWIRVQHLGDTARRRLIDHD